MSIKPFHLLIPAAGTGTRLGDDTPKQYLPINGKSVLRHSIEKFLDIEGLISIHVIINPDHEALYKQAVKGLELSPHVTGSKTRKLSIYNGLKCFPKVKNDEIIIIHDAARPLVETDNILLLLEAMKKAKAATLATPISDTLIRNGKNIDRDNLWAVQTPQAFHLQSLIEAHEKFAEDEGFTDDAGLMQAMGHAVKIIPAPRSNIKITTKEDLDMAQKLINATYETRMASGFDVHAFEKAPSDRKLILGGAHIPHMVALTGHSDADVVLHAITDAVLGSINEGDIGTHFPPSDPQWQDANSALFLRHAHDMLMAKSGKIQFIDVTLMAEEPKIGPHRAAMQKKIAEILGISTERVSIKATTTEKLGFTGRKEGMACQAHVTVLLPQ